MKSPDPRVMRGKTFAVQCIEALLEAGDEIIIPMPFRVSYQDQTLC